jgi:hypothetical protein
LEALSRLKIVKNGQIKPEAKEIKKAEKKEISE